MRTGVVRRGMSAIKSLFTQIRELCTATHPKEQVMSVTDLQAHRKPEYDAAHPEGGAPGTDATAPASLEDEIRMMREEFAKLRNLIAEREKNGRTLINAYKEVIADFADLFEAQRKEGIKREESLRFFLSSIEGRIREDIRAELGTDPADIASSRRGIWPFRRG
ncbi:MAG: hypothetical protein GEU92_03725 [Alphaproteobacteria bacterium]|nr:hypothetical protein [Alphaproteobacteria bacterium]